MDSLQRAIFGILAFKYQVSIEYDDSNCGKERSEIENCEKLLAEAIGSNRQLKSLLERLSAAYENMHVQSVPHYYKKGFIHGAQLMMEILGCSISNENKGKLDELLSYFAKMQ